MILDEENLFSDKQAVTVTAGSTNVVDLGVKRDIGKGTPIPLLIQCTEDAAADGAATVKFSVRISDNSDMSNSKTVIETGAIPKADLVAGYQVPISYIPLGTEGRHVDVYYTVATGPLTAGKFTAGITAGNQTNV